MRASILIVLIFILGCSVYAQEGVVLDIPSSAPIIINKYDDNVEYAGSLPSKIYPFMKLDIFRWYGLHKEYDTELKQKVFLETEEGKRLLKGLKEMRQKVMTSNAYFIHTMAGLNKGKYDLATKTFNIEFQPDFPAISGYMHFPNIVVKCNLPVKQEPYVTPASNKTITPPYNYYNIIKLPMSEQTALLIENNISQLEFVLEFKIEQYKDPAWYISYFQGTAINMYIIDKDSHEIYYAVDKSRLKVLKAQQEKIRQEELRQAELARLEGLKREEEARQERIRREEYIKKLLALTNEQTINEQIAIYRHSRILEETRKLSAQYPNPHKAEINEEVEVLIHLDSTIIDVVQIAEQRLNYELYLLFKIDTKPYCSLDGVNYYKFQNHIFYTKKIPINATVEKGLLGVKNKNGTLKYYGTFPSEVQEWCKKHIISNGFQEIQYTHYDNQYITKTATITKESAKSIQKKQFSPIRCEKP